MGDWVGGSVGVGENIFDGRLAGVEEVFDEKAVRGEAGGGGGGPAIGPEGGPVGQGNVEDPGPELVV